MISEGVSSHEGPAEPRGDPGSTAYCRERMGKQKRLEANCGGVTPLDKDMDVCDLNEDNKR